MSCKQNFKQLILRVTAALVGVAALWFLLAWLVWSPSSSASGVFRPLTFHSPIHPVGDPVLNIVKTVDNNSPSPGDEIEYTLTYSTTDPGSEVFNVEVYDFLPAGVQFVSSNPPASASGGVWRLTHPSLDDVNQTVTIRVRVPNGYRYQHLYNRAIVVGDGVDAAHDSLLTPVLHPPKSLQITKLGDPVVLADGELVYRLRCENPNLYYTAEDVTVVDVLPLGVSNVQASPPPDEMTFPMLSWSLGDLAPGARRTIRVTVTAPSAAGVITNTTFADAQNDWEMTNDLFATEVITQGAILRLEKLGSAEEADVGDELLYTLEYENIGNETATGVILTDTLPANVSYVSASGTVTVGGGLVVWDIGEVISETTGAVTLTVEIVGGRGTTLRNWADITADNCDPRQDYFDTAVRKAMIYLPLVMRGS
ncbi:MAG TPA: DUF11 domain-containing protein [Chloroflexi bacterium]|nr:DUF11 domain-containing protein [Chloroflexota bacterium]HDQ71600.1 DUF11 domain-containing protein [Chloroflexota bacterium]